MRHPFRKPNIVANLLLAAVVLAAFGLWILNDAIPNEDVIFVAQLERGDLLAVWRNVSWSNAADARLCLFLPSRISLELKVPAVPTKEE